MVDASFPVIQLVNSVSDETLEFRDTLASVLLWLLLDSVPSMRVIMLAVSAEFIECVVCAFIAPVEFINEILPDCVVSGEIWLVEASLAVMVVDHESVVIWRFSVDALM
jgi:hypothetical protein